MGKVLPGFKGSKASGAGPSRAVLRVKGDKSRRAQSKSSAERPRRNMPHTGEGEPVHWMPCEESVGPKCRKSKTKTAGSSLLQLRGDMGEPRVVKSKVNSKEPRRMMLKIG